MPILGVVASGISGHLTNNAYDSIQTVTVGAAQSTISFTSIPATYTHLQIRFIARDDGPGTGAVDLNLRFNSDTGSNYYWHAIYGNGTIAGGTSAVSTLTATRMGYATEGASSANMFSGFVTDILDYKNTNKYKVHRTIGASERNGSGNILFESGLWMSTSAITRIDITHGGAYNFNTYSSFALYGIK